MNDFTPCNKISGTYWLKKDLNGLLIKIKLKPQNGIISLPKFEDYSNSSNISNLENISQEYLFKWQEKTFSQWEVQRYSDHHNCMSETEIKYYEVLKNTDLKPSKIFTYVHEDYYMPIPLDDMKKKSGLLNLERHFAQLSLGQILGKSSNTLSTTHLFNKSQEVDTEETSWRAMHIVFDNSDYNGECNLIYKQEVPLVSLYHNITQNCLILRPDVNNLELNPYTVELVSGMQCEYHYSVEVEFDNLVGADELLVLLRRLYKRWEKKQRNLLSFQMPPIGTRQFYVTLEILTASQFEMDNLYIDFNFKVPEELECKDTLHGKTHTNECLVTEKGEIWNFGHIVEFTLETTKIDPAPLKLFFEVISIDWWGRHRTEGYTYLPLALQPGCHTKQLTCRRPEELNTVEANSRRFFLGGCHLIKDLDVLMEPQLKDANFTFTTTGSILIRWQIISQWQQGNIRSGSLPENISISTASVLLKGAEAALHKYRRAKARLAAATEHINDDKSHENTSLQGTSQQSE